MIRKQWMMVTVAAISSVASALGASPVIGVATANGTFQLNGSDVHGNATVLEGSKISTDKSSSLVQLKSGAKVSLAANSGTQLFKDRAVMERGTGQFISGGDYRLEAGALEIQPTSGQSEIRVNVVNGKAVQVAAVRGNLLVKNKTGIVLASMVPGTALAFDPQEAGASLGVSINGVLKKIADRVYVITDTVSNVTYQVVGCDDLASRVDKTVKINGSLVQNATLAPAAVNAGATQEVRVGNCAAVAAVVAAGAAAAAGLSTGAIVAGIAVAAAGTGVGLGVALSQGNGVGNGACPTPPCNQ